MNMLHSLAAVIVVTFVGTGIYSGATRAPIAAAQPAPAPVSKPASAPAAAKLHPEPDRYSDGLAAMTLGKILVDGGVVMKSDTDTSIMQGYRHLNVWISSLSPADARQSAKVICRHARRLWNYTDVWHVQVFISTGSAVPAGRCRI